MSDVQFDPETWRKASKRTAELRSSFQSATQEIIFAELARSGRSPVDATLAAEGKRLHLKWYDVCGNMVEKLNSGASKLRATANTYAETADSSENVIKRFWRY